MQEQQSVLGLLLLLHGSTQLLLAGGWEWCGCVVAGPPSPNPFPPHKHPLLLGITPQQGCQGTPNAACLCKGSLAGPPINAPVLLQWGLVGSDPWAQHALPLLSQTCLLLIRAQLTSALGISPA
jgi:hypothetical protein